MPSLSMLRNAPAPLPSLQQLRCSRLRPRDASAIAATPRRRCFSSNRGCGDRVARASLINAHDAVAGLAAIDQKRQQGQQQQQQQQQRPLCALRPARPPAVIAEAAAASDPAFIGGQPEESGDDSEAEDCKVGFVTVDNAASRSCTLLRLEAADYIGLTRVVAWVLGGLGLLVRDARLTTGEDGWARNEFWVTTESGRKLSDARAASASERLAEFVTYCTPPPRRQGQEAKVESGGITVDSSERAHAKWTVVTIRGGVGGGGGVGDGIGGGFGGASGRVGAISSFGPSSSSTSSPSSYSSSSPLLDVASAVSGAGIAIREAIVIGGGPSCDGSDDDDDEGASNGGGEGDEGVVVNGVGNRDGRRPTIDDDPEEGETSSSSSSSPSSSNSSSSSNGEPAMRLWVCEPATGGKLSYVRCAALLQTLSLALGRGGGPSLVPPAPVTMMAAGREE